MKRSQFELLFELLIDEVTDLASTLQELAGQKADLNQTYWNTILALLNELQSKIQILRLECVYLAEETEGQLSDAFQFAREKRTPVEAFRQPILEVLAELGGRGRVSTILQRIESKVELNRYDKQRLPLHRPPARWQRTVRLCRSLLVKEGVLKPDSPRGIWEISEKGREALQSLARIEGGDTPAPPAVETAGVEEGARPSTTGAGIGLQGRPEIGGIRHRARRISPEKRGGRPRGPSPDAQLAERPQSWVARPELVCWKRGQEWVVGVELPDEISYGGSVNVFQVDISLVRDRLQDNCYPLASLIDDVTIYVAKPGLDTVLDVPVDGGRPLLFKLRGKTLNQGRKVKQASSGVYLVIAPETWERDEQKAGRAPIAPEPVSIKGYRAHFFDLNESAHLQVALQNDQRETVVVGSGGPRFYPVGQSLPDATENMGPLFGGVPPRIGIIGKWEDVGTIVIGEEGRGRRRWRRGFKPIPEQSEQELPEDLRARRCGWYFLRFYDRDDNLIDSFDFRFAPGLQDIRIPACEPSPGPDGYRSVMVEVVHEPDYAVQPASSGCPDVEIKPDKNGTTILIPPKPDCDRIRLLILPGTGHGRPVEADVLLERVWWAVGNEYAAPAVWGDRPVSISFGDLVATSDRALWLLMPTQRWAKGVRVGFEGAELRTCNIRTVDRTVCIPLRELSGLSDKPPETKVSLQVRVEREGSSYTIQPCVILASFECCQCGFICPSQREILSHVELCHLEQLMKPLTYDELRQRDPSLPQILKCGYCGFYASESEYSYPTNAIEVHIEQDCKNAIREHGKAIVRLSSINLEEIRGKIIPELPLIFKCKFCGRDIKGHSGPNLMEHLIKQHKDKLYVAK